MRLTPEQRQIIRTTVAEVFGPEAQVWLFGSRVDDNQRGGDIDLLIYTQQSDREQLLRKEISLLTRLNKEMGEQKIDVLMDYPHRRQRPPILAVAYQSRIPL